MATISFNELRDNYQTFIYHGFTYQRTSEGVDISFHYDIPGLSEFAPSLQIPGAQWDLRRDPDSPQGEAFIYTLGLLELIDYWKTTCAPVILLPGAILHDEQLRFWRDLYYDGLEAFFFRNGVDLKREEAVTLVDSVHLTEEQNKLLKRRALTSGGRVRSVGTADAPIDLSQQQVEGVATKSEAAGVLIPVGEGKGSVVTLELLSKVPEQKRLVFALNPSSTTQAIVEQAGIPAQDTRYIRRFMDSELLELHGRGFLNSMAPLGLLLPFMSAYVAWLTGLDTVIHSHEATQQRYAQSLAFEHAATAYIRRYLTSEIQSYSLLRPLSELAVTRAFSEHPTYLPIVRSCKRATKAKPWCGSCKDCLYTYLIFAPFVAADTLRELWGKDLWADLELTKPLQELLGLTPLKPFEHPGTPEEATEALKLVLDIYPEEELPALLREAKRWPVKQASASMLEAWESDHRVPETMVWRLEGLNRSYTQGA